MADISRFLINGVGSVAVDGTITPSDVATGKVGYANNKRITGTMPDTMDGTITAVDVVQGKVGYSKKTKITGIKKPMVKQMFFFTMQGSETKTFPASVVTQNTAVWISGGVYSSSNDYSFYRINLSTNAVSVAPADTDIYLNLQIVEFNPEYVKSFQTGSVSSGSGSFSTPVSINPVNPAYCLVTAYGTGTSDASNASSIRGGAYVSSLSAEQIIIMERNRTPTRAVTWRLLELQPF